MQPAISFSSLSLCLSVSLLCLPVSLLLCLFVSLLLCLSIHLFLSSVSLFLPPSLSKGMEATLLILSPVILTVGAFRRTIGPCVEVMASPTPLPVMLAVR